MKTVYYNTTTGTLYDVERGRELPRAQYPWIRYREKSELKIILITGHDGSGNPILDTSIDETLSYEAAIDKDHSSNTTVMVKTINDNITVDASIGEIVILLDANTAEFLAATNGSKSFNGFFELQGNDVSELVWSIDFPVVCKGTINAGADDPDPIPANDYYTAVETDAAIAAGKPSRVSNFAALPGSPADLISYFVTTLGFVLRWDAITSEWKDETGNMWDGDS